MYTVYALKSVNYNYIYVGQTSNLPQRLNQHNSGHEKTTKPYSPFVIIYKEEHELRTTAREREKYWKSGTGKRKLKKLAENVEV